MSLSVEANTRGSASEFFHVVATHSKLHKKELL